ncbi:MAG TPA: alpha/beta hydrolase [Sutterella sp.]|nr:alpha/beta hydrolase [Sutterella sp.]
MPVITPDYVPPRWAPDAHTQTVIPAKLSRKPKVAYRRELIDMPDGDFMTFDWATPEPADPAAPTIVHFHGLEGSSDSHYALALMDACAKRGWRGVVAHFRGCGGLPNRLPRAYFAGDSADCEWAIQTVQKRFPAAPLFAVGVSLGGNQVAKFLGDRGESARYLTGAVSVGAPVDLVAGSVGMTSGINLMYTKMFLSTLIEKVKEKARQFPDVVSTKKLPNCRTLNDFDDMYTAPIHGFKDSIDYWTQCSAKRVLKNVRVPLLLLNSRNDPFLPAEALPTEGEVSEYVYLEQPDEGGHIGYPEGAFPGDLDYLPRKILGFFDGLLAAGG